MTELEVSDMLSIWITCYSHIFNILFWILDSLWFSPWQIYIWFLIKFDGSHNFNFCSFDERMKRTVLIHNFWTWKLKCKSIHYTNGRDVGIQIKLCASISYHNFGSLTLGDSFIRRSSNSISHNVLGFGMSWFLQFYVLRKFLKFLKFY